MRSTSDARACWPSKGDRQLATEEAAAAAVEPSAAADDGTERMSVTFIWALMRQGTKDSSVIAAAPLVAGDACPPASMITRKPAPMPAEDGQTKVVYRPWQACCTCR